MRDPRTDASDPPPEPHPWDAYRNTVLHFGDPAAWSIRGRDLMRPEAIARLGALGLEGPFAVITAFDPHPDRLGAAENLARHGELARAIRSAGHRHLACAGASPDGSHREEGFAVRCSLAEAIVLADRFGQAAIYWWDGRVLWIEPVRSPWPRERVADASAAAGRSEADGHWEFS